MDDNFIAVLAAAGGAVSAIFASAIALDLDSTEHLDGQSFQRLSRDDLPFDSLSFQLLMLILLVVPSILVGFVTSFAAAANQLTTYPALWKKSGFRFMASP